MILPPGDAVHDIVEGREDRRRMLDIGLLLTLAVAALVIRIPGGLPAVVIASLIVVLVRGIRVGTQPTGLLWPMLLVAWLASLVSTFVLHPENLTNSGGSFASMTVVLLIAVAVVFTGSPKRTTWQMLAGLYWGLRVLWLIAMGEVITGVKLMTRLYPGTTVESLVKDNRLYASATFPNYNDFCVAMVLLVSLELAMLLFGRLGRLRFVTSTIVLVTAVVLIVAMGSRGSLIGIIGVGVVMLFMWGRWKRPDVVNLNVAVVGVGLALIIAIALIGNGEFSDRSSEIRVRISGTVMALWGANPISALVGFSSSSTYSDIVHEVFPGLLLDPHNLMLEIGIWYGLPALLVAAGCWVVIVWRGLVSHAGSYSPLAAATIVLVAIYPVLGVVPSSTLRYHVFWMIMIASSVYSGTKASASEFD